MSAVLDRRASPQARLRADPVGGLRNMFDFDPWYMQRQIIRSVWAHPRTAVRSGNGVGKTAIAFGGVGPAFLLAHTNSIVVTTAPTWRQVQQQGWREWRRSWNAMRGKLAAFPALREVPIPACLRTSVELGEQWHAYGLSTNEPEAFAGVHARRVLFIGDEASGIDDRIFEAAEGYLTGAGARVLLIGNPTQTAGQFYRAFTSERAQWNTLHINAYDSPWFTGEIARLGERAQGLVTPEWVEDKRKRWGEESPIFQIRVMGNFSEEADDTILSLVAVERAQRLGYEEDLGVKLLDFPTVTIACDVARFGSDETVLMRKRGPVVDVQEVYHGRDTMVTAGKCLQAVREALSEDAVLRVRLVVDDDGVGGGVTDRLRETMQSELQSDRVDLVPFHGGEAAIRPDRYANKRTEAWFRAKWQIPQLDLPPKEDDLAADLVSVKYRVNSNGTLQAERKEDVKKRLGRSPDRGDALVMLLEPERKSRLADTPPHVDVEPDENAYELDF